MSEQHTPGRLVEDTRGPRADIRSESGRIVAVTYGLGFPKTAEGLEKRTKEDRANRRRLAACWNACEGIDTEYLEGDDSLPHYARRLMAQRDELLAASVNARDMLATERQAFVDCNAIHKLTTNLDQERIVVYGDGIWLDKDDAEVVGDYDRALAQLDAAIAKATGEQT